MIYIRVAKRRLKNKMAKNKGWWTLELNGNSHNDLSEVDLEHIAELIKQGYTNGEIIKDN